MGDMPQSAPGAVLPNVSKGSARGAVRPGRYAAIDIGTVTCRMLVADIDEEGLLRELDREYAITNLGEGVDASGVLRPEAMSRVLDAVARYQEVLSGFERSGRPVRVTAVATSAARDARNAGEFEHLLAERGIELSVIPGARGGVVVRGRVVRLFGRTSARRGHRRRLHRSRGRSRGRRSCSGALVRHRVPPRHREVSRFRSSLRPRTRMCSPVDAGGDAPVFRGVARFGILP